MSFCKGRILGRVPDSSEALGKGGKLQKEWRASGCPGAVVGEEEMTLQGKLGEC